MKIILLLLVAITALSAWHMNSGSELDPVLLRRAQNAARAHPDVVASRFIMVVDYHKNLAQTRLWVYDQKAKKVVLASRVAHAINSGLFYPTSFSNAQGSKKSCTGSFVTGSTFQGKYGYSLRVNGLDRSNSNALSRGIILHSAITPYSFGCFVTNVQTNTRLINLVKNGSFVFVTP